MARSPWLVGGVLTLGALCAGGTPGGLALAGGNGRGPLEKDECIYTAHGSPAAERQNAKAGGGGSGGGKTSCSKTFAKWQKAAPATLNVYIDGTTGNPGSIAASAFVDSVTYSLKQWACHSGLGNYTLNFNSTSAAADITVSWGDLGSTGILGQTQTWYSGGVISHSDVKMNNNAAITWVSGPDFVASTCADQTGDFAGDTTSSNYDFLSVLVHEVGHSLGVSHPNNRCLSFDSCYPQTMYSCTDAEEWFRRSLDSGDLASIKALYGQ